jgi:hypothetical protein
VNPIPFGCPEWPQWGRIPTFFEEAPQLLAEDGRPVHRIEGATITMERRTVLGGVAYLVRGHTTATGIYEYVSCQVGDRQARCIGRCEAGITKVMANFPSYLIRIALS